MKVNRCRVCKQSQLFEILNYGKVVLADAFLDHTNEFDTEEKYPLALCICNNCGHLQIDEEIDPEVLFRNYIYVTGVSDAVFKHAEHLYNSVTSLLQNPSGEVLKIYEPASNDGTILNVFKQKGCDVLGIEPATNIAKIANERNISTINEFFSEKTAKKLLKYSGSADVCIARNVLAHVCELHGFVKGLGLVLKKNGIGIVEVPHALNMYKQLQYDQVFHEHISYFTVLVLQRLFEMHNLKIFHVEEVSIHGGSVRIFFQRDEADREIRSSVERAIQEEKVLGLDSVDAWKEFAKKVSTQKELLLKELKKIKSEGKKIAVYGASGKGQSLLQFCEIGKQYIDFVVDKSPMKHGKFTPGTHIPVYSTTEIMKCKPDVILLCAWNFAEEIYSQQSEYINQGGRLLHPIPVPHYL